MPSDTDKYKNIGQRLRRARLALNWSQEELARAINTTAVSISRWERGVVLPQPHYREQLCRAFNTTAELLFEIDEHEHEQEDEESTLPEVWNIPYRRNPLFTGRTDILAMLANALHTESMVALTQAISGLGGIGKTQTVLEYAYRYRDDYSAILWVRAETREVFITDLIALAELLNLPEKNEQDQQHTIEAIKRWLRDHTGWLLILDNVEDVMMVTDILPPTYDGHTVMTTRSQATGSIAQRIDVALMESDEATLFLLRRAKLIGHDTALEAVSEQTRDEAGRVWQTLGGLPLALDQAGAYIEETGCSLTDYLDCYQVRRTELLHLRGRLNTDHPQSVAATLSLSFENIARTNPEAVELLRLCAFLHPDAIPKEMLVEGAPRLGPILQTVVTDPLEFDRVLAALRTYSLLQRNADTKTLTIHRLVQAVVKDSMDREMQRQWAERVVRAINHAFPDESRKLPIRSRCQSYLPHALTCVALIDEWQMHFPEAAHLLHRTGFYLMESGHYTQVEQFFIKARDMSIQTLGEQHPEVGQILNHLAELYFYQGRYGQAELMNQQALPILENALGPIHPDVATALNNKAVFYHAQDKYSEAEPLYRQALAIRRQAFGAEHPDVAESLNNLAYFYYTRRDYAQTESFYRQALTIYEKVVGPECAEVARSLNNIATLYRTLGKYTEAEPLHKQALVLYEKCLGPEHREVAFGLNNLANTYHVQGKYEQAESFFRRALALREKVLGPENPDVATSLHCLAWHYFEQGKYAEALPLYQQALAIRERTLGPDHALTAQTLYDLAKLHAGQRDYTSAESLYRRALIIRKKALGSEHPDVIATMGELVTLLSNTGRDTNIVAIKVHLEER